MFARDAVSLEHVSQRREVYLTECFKPLLTFSLAHYLVVSLFLLYIRIDVYHSPHKKTKRSVESDDCQCSSEIPCYPDMCLNALCCYECDPEVCAAGENCCNQRIQQRRWLIHPKIKLVEVLAVEICDFIFPNRKIFI